MSFVAAASTVGAWAGIGAAGSTAAIIGGGALIGAGVGGAYSALTGDGKILDSMLTGAGIGGLGAWGLNAAGVSSGVAAPTSTITGAGLTATPAGQAAVASNTPAVAAYGNTAALDAASGSLASGSNLVPAGASNSFGLGATGATNTGLNSLYPGAAPSGMTSAAGLSGAQMLGYGLGATTLMGLMGGQPKGVDVPTDPGMIRPYEYDIARREPEAGKSYYFEPIEYDKYGQTTKPLDTSERNYFTQNYTALPTYKAAMGGQVPQYEQMQPGGLAAIQGMRDGYAPLTTMDGNIPQFAFGGTVSATANDGSLPRYSFDPQTRQYTSLNNLSQATENDSRPFSPFNSGLFGDTIRRIVGLAKQNEQSGNKFSYDPSTQKYSRFSNGGPTNKMMDQMQQMKFERDMPDEMRDYLRAKRMGLLESGMIGEEQAKLAGGKMPEFMFVPSASQDLKNINAMAMLNKDLDEDTKLKLMATGYSNPDKKGIGTYGAGLTRKLDKDSDLSAFFEQSPDRKYQSYGARYNRRFNQGGMTDGNLGGYSDGGQLLRGPGDGVSDSIPASINNRQPARLADGEFVIPARIVSELGNGSTDAGAKRLYEMMDRIQADRKKTVGKGKVAVDSKAKKHLPA